MLPIILDDGIIISKTADKDTSLATMGENFSSPEVFLMENSIALGVSLRVVVFGIIDLIRLAIVIISVLKVIDHDNSLLPWLIMNGLTSYFVLTGSHWNSISVLRIITQVSWKTWIVYYVLWLDIHVCRDSIYVSAAASIINWIAIVN